MKNQNKKLYGELTGRLLSRYIANIDLNQNVVFSPLSVLILLGMLMDATDGQTRKEIAKIFGCEKKPAGIIRWLNDIQKELAKSGALKSSNAVCVKASLKDKIMPGYEKHIRKLFDGRLFASSDMTNDVNQWVCENTNGMIQQIADDSINDMLACLMNALAFEARWEHEYEFIDIVPGDFHNADKSSNEVSMMRSTEMQYIEDAHFTGFTKPYKKVGYSYMALLPKKDDPEYLKKAVRKLDLSSLYRSRRSERVITRIPEYKFEYSDILNGFCEELGIKTAFSDHADFGPMMHEWLKIDQIIHKAFIQVDRNGTKAASATMSLLQAGGISQRRFKIVELDRPFLFAIVHDDSRLPVFVGVVNHLEQEDFEFDGYEPEDHHFKNTEEREQCAKALYRKLAYRLHPDVNPLYETTKEIRGLFDQAQECYIKYDVRGLEVVEHNVDVLIEKLGLDGSEIEENGRNRGWHI